MNISGEVIGGQKRGRDLGFPTANVALTKEDQSEVKDGTYAGCVVIDGVSYLAAIFVPWDKSIIEAHILDFDCSLYGSSITIIMEKRLRDNIKFESVEKLTAQITKDVNAVREGFWR